MIRFVFPRLDSFSIARHFSSRFFCNRFFSLVSSDSSKNQLKGESTQIQPESFLRSKCDPFDQKGKPIAIDEAIEHAKKLTNWIIHEYDAGQEPIYEPMYAILSEKESRFMQNEKVGEKQNERECESFNACENKNCCKISLPLERDDRKQSNRPALGSKKFKGGLLLRREFRFKKVDAANDFIIMVKQIQENQSHEPFRVFLDTSRGYGHVMIELYTPFLGGLSYNDFSFAFAIDTELKIYATKQKEGTK